MMQLATVCVIAATAAMTATAESGAGGGSRVCAGGGQVPNEADCVGDDVPPGCPSAPFAQAWTEDQLEELENAEASSTEVRLLQTQISHGRGATSSNVSAADAVAPAFSAIRAATDAVEVVPKAAPAAARSTAAAKASAAPLALSLAKAAATATEEETMAGKASFPAVPAAAAATAVARPPAAKRAAAARRPAATKAAVAAAVDDTATGKPSLAGAPAASASAPAIARSPAAAKAAATARSRAAAAVTSETAALSAAAAPAAAQSPAVPPPPSDPASAPRLGSFHGAALAHLRRAAAAAAAAGDSGGDGAAAAASASTSWAAAGGTQAAAVAAAEIEVAADGSAAAAAANDAGETAAADSSSVVVETAAAEGATAPPSVGDSVAAIPVPLTLFQVGEEADKHTKKPHKHHKAKRGRAAERGGASPEDSTMEFSAEIRRGQLLAGALFLALAALAGLAIRCQLRSLMAFPRLRSAKVRTLPTERLIEGLSLERQLPHKGLDVGALEIGTGADCGGGAALAAAAEKAAARWPQAAAAAAAAAAAVRPSASLVALKRLHHVGTSFSVPLSRLDAKTASGKMVTFEVPVWPAVWPLRATLARSQAAGPWDRIELTHDIIAAEMPPLLTCRPAGARADAKREATNHFLGLGGAIGFGTRRPAARGNLCIEVHDGSRGLVASLRREAPGKLIVLRKSGLAWQIETCQKEKMLAVRRHDGHEVAVATEFCRGGKLDDSKEECLQVDTHATIDSPEASQMFMIALAVVVFDMDREAAAPPPSQPGRLQTAWKAVVGP